MFSTNIISRLGNHPTVLGGDWNATISCLPVDTNPDVMFMQDIPSLPHSKKIWDLCNAHALVDPFRVLYPNRRDFSYSPWGNLRRNRSRIDFFLVSSSIVDKVDDCFIKPHRQSKLFDHKAIVLDFCKKKHPWQDQPYQIRFCGIRILILWSN
jgi:exonuclease III